MEMLMNSVDTKECSFSFTNLRVLGEYKPDNLEFLNKYDFLIITSEKSFDSNLNYAFCMPNKLLQAWSHGVSVLLPYAFYEASSYRFLHPILCQPISSYQDIPDCIDLLSGHRKNPTASAAFLRICDQLQIHSKCAFTDLLVKR
jgi:hypothetical protein